MTRVTRDIDPGRARDLLERPPRACMCFAGDDGPHVQPIAFLSNEGRHLAGVPAGAGQLPAAGQEVAILIDEGVHYFQLRAIHMRGPATPAGAPSGGPHGHTWFEVVPTQTAAWDYGSMREVGGAR